MFLELADLISYRLFPLNRWSKDKKSINNGIGLELESLLDENNEISRFYSTF